MISARPVTPARGRPAAMPLAVATRSGTTSSCSLANQAPVRQKPRLHLVGDEQDAVLGAPGGQMRAGTRGRHDEAALALDRLDEHAGHVAGADLLVDQVEGPVGRIAPLMPAGIPERVGHRHPVHLRGERPEPVLVGHVLGGQGHGQVGAAVVGVIEHDDRLAAGGVAGHLDGVLDRLGPGVEQGRGLGVAPGVRALSCSHTAT